MSIQPWDQYCEDELLNIQEIIIRANHLVPTNQIHNNQGMWKTQNINQQKPNETRFHLPQPCSYITIDSFNNTW